ncbi:WXG100-like domain-containing protein [Streptomyces lydicus]|uniref:WXG100-like domain-containing protein n=1 Tax=Streptomyces lydicus TaxID=47763 RepID=UPI0037111986
MGESAAAKIVRKTTGMWWPDADSDGLRQAADAWRTMATALDDVAASCNKAEKSVVEGAHGKSIDAFESFWHRYKNGSNGWLPETAHACRQMAKALDDFAEKVDEAVHKLEEEAALVGATLVAGTALAIFTAGISEAAAGAATAGIIATAESVGVAVSETVASIAATTLTGAAFGAVESVVVDAAVAQPIRISFGDGGFSGTELLDAAETGGAGGALGAGLGSGARAVGQAASGAEGASTILAGIGKISTGMDTMPGRMVTGAALGAGQDALFNGGHINPLDVATGAIGGAAGGRQARNRTAGTEDFLPYSGSSDHIDSPQSPKAERVYERIRQTEGDTHRISENTGIKKDVLDRIKGHIFHDTHKDVVVDRGKKATGRFAPMDHIADLWTKAESGALSGDEARMFKRWAAHEGVESALMREGIPYRSDALEAFDNEFEMYDPSPDHWGAHDVAPHEYAKNPDTGEDEPFRAWPKVGLPKPDLKIADDLSNLDEVIALIRKGKSI